MDKVIFDVLRKIQGVMVGHDKEFWRIEEFAEFDDDLYVAKLSDMARAKQIPSHQYKGRTYLILSEIHELISKEYESREAKEGISSDLDPNVLYSGNREYHVMDIALLQFKELLTIDDVAIVTDLSRGCILGLVLDNKIPYHGKGNKVYFIKSEIKEWMKFSPYYLNLWTKKNL